LKKIPFIIISLSILLSFSQASSVKSTTYKVQKGDSLYLLAKRYHTTIAQLRKLNGMTQNDILKAGKKIKVPAVKVVKKKKPVKKHMAKKKVQKRTKVAHKRAPKKSIAQKKPTTRRFSLSEIVFGHSNKSLEKSKKIISLAKQKLGRKYVWGAAGQRNTFDCSGLTSYVCKANGIVLPRRAIQQSRYGKPVKRSELQPGDLVFFDTSKQRKGYVNHVGIYIGDGKFIHASSAKKKVVITSLNKPFYSQRFKGARRVTSL